MIFLCNVNNSISHPPHPRRAVPANLPPGAFFFLLGSLGRVFFLLSFVYAHSVYGVVVEEKNLSQRITELRLKSNAHGKFVSELLGNPVEFEPIEVDGNAPVQSSVSSTKVDGESLPAAEIPPRLSPSPHSGLPDVEEKEVIQNPMPDSVEDSSPSSSSEESGLSNQPPSRTKTPDTYDELYKPKIPQRRMGYYFGPFVGLVFPDDGAVRYPKESFQSDGGIIGGLRLGHDFGGMRVEGEYAFLTHKISHGRSKLHNFQGRFILEKNIGSRADLRGGIGMGLGIVNHDYKGHNYKGAGFSYDFLLGWSYRVMENWSLNLDYRHYLTAAHENYDRLQGHVIELSAGFDL